MKKIGKMKVPVNSLAVLLAATKEIYKESSGKEITKARIAESIGHAPGGGAFNDKIKDLKEYGLIEGRADRYIVTELGKKITIPRDDSEETAALLQAVKNIDLWKRLLEEVGTSINAANFWHHLENITGADRSVAKNNAETVMKAYLKDVELIKSVGEPKMEPESDEISDSEAADRKPTMDSQSVGSKKASIDIGQDYGIARFEIRNQKDYDTAQNLLETIRSSLDLKKAGTQLLLEAIASKLDVQPTTSGTSTDDQNG